MENQEKKIEGNRYAIVEGRSLPISRKHAMELCKFIRNKKAQDAIDLLEKVIQKKVAVPSKRQVAHRKGKGIAGGRYHVKASGYFIKLLRSLIANANAKGLSNIIVNAMANKGPVITRPGRRRRKFKRTHITIRAIEKEMKTNEQEKNKNKEQTKQEAEQK